MSSTETEELKIEIPGGQVYIKKWIPEFDNGKAPIILLHDSLGSVDLWQEFPERLSQAFSRSVFAYDRLGFGKSDARNSLPSKKFVEEEAAIYFPSIKKFVITSYSIHYTKLYDMERDTRTDVPEENRVYGIRMFDFDLKWQAAGNKIRGLYLAPV